MTYYQVPARSQIKIGARVKIAEKINYQSGEITEGIVQAILTSKETHPRGVKVRLTTGIIGRVQALGDQELNPIGNDMIKVTNIPNVDYRPQDDELI